MKLRTFAVAAAVLVAAAIAAWLWSGNEQAPELVVAPAALPGTPSPAPVAPPVRDPAPPVVAAATPAPAAAAPAAPVRIATAVEPGMPMVRTITEPPPPVAVAPVAANQGRPPRPVPQAEAQGDLENVLLMLRDFRTRLGENPTGSNAEIMRAVMGGNPVRANLGPPAGQSLNDQGELVDRWGTPYFFHQLAKDTMEIRSAGPDQKLWTSDDLVTK